jgi:hypothetical protein
LVQIPRGKNLPAAENGAAHALATRIQKTIKLHLKKAQERQRHDADQRRDVEHKEGV